MFEFHFQLFYLLFFSF